MITPALRQLGETYPGSRIVVACSRAAAQCLKGNPFVHDVIPVDRENEPLSERFSRFVRIRNERFDLVIDFHCKVPSALTSLFSGAPLRIGFQKQGRSLAYSRPVPEPPEPIYRIFKNQALLAPLGVLPPDRPLLPELYPHADDHRWAADAWERLGLLPSDTVVAVSPVSIVAMKVWPADRFAALCDALIERYGLKVLLMHGPGEDDVSLSVHCRMTFSDQTVIAPVGTLTGCAALMKRCVCWVGNDNGPRHLAIAAGLPTFGIFGPIDPVRWTPPDNSAHRYLAGRTQAGPHVPVKAMIRSVSVADVKHAVFEWIDAGAYA